MTSQWETIYAAGKQLNAYPYSEAVSFMMRGWPGGFPKGFRALDVGCGSGVHAALFADHGAKVTAFDFSASAIAAAQDRQAGKGISFVQADLDSFEADGTAYDLVFDRLSSTHSSLDSVTRFYQRLRPTLGTGARLFWQGYDPDNSGRAFGTHRPENGYWDGFTDGVFEGLGPTVFFSDDDVSRVFDGYTITSKRILSDRNLLTGYTHSYWMLEMTAS